MREYIFSFAFLSFALVSVAQQVPYAAEIAAFRKQDSLQPPPQNAILFVGSSSFTFWKDVQKWFPKKTIINRGFGGSTLLDVIRYEEQTIFKYNPKQIVIYCGENDVAYSDTVTTAMVLTRFQQLFTDIRNRLPDVPIAYVSIKPSPSRWALRERMQAANEAIKRFLKQQSKTKWVDVWKPMLAENGEPKPEIFGGDRLHMNEKGYTIWAKKIKKVLK